MLKAFHSKGLIEAGCDEAGRGCLAGPVVASAVILPTNFKHILLNDSKQLTHKQRELLEPIIKEKAICWAIGIVSPQEIDEINIHQATLLAMQEAIISLPITPDWVYVDGKFTPTVEVNCKAVIGGDKLIPEISAASIIAKVHRDEFMKKLDKKYPIYAFAKNKGYGTPYHLNALKEVGYTSFHRQSFKGVVV